MRLEVSETFWLYFHRLRALVCVTVMCAVAGHAAHPFYGYAPWVFGAAIAAFVAFLALAGLQVLAALVRVVLAPKPRGRRDQSGLNRMQVSS